MIRRALLPALFALTAGLTATAQAPDLPPHEERVSPSGIEFWSITLPEAETIAAQLVLPASHAHLGAGENADPLGIASALVGPDMMFLGGAGGLDTRQFANASQDLSAFADISASADRVTLSFELNPTLVEPGAALLASLITAPRFDPRWLTRHVRQAKIDAAEPRVEAPARAYDAYTYARLGTSPLAALQRNQDPSLYDLITPEALHDWHGQVFHLAHARPVIAGPLDADAAGLLVDQLFGALPRTGPGTPLSGDTPPTNESDAPLRILLQDPDASNGFALFWGPATSSQDLEAGADNVLAGLLFAGGGLEAPLFEALRTELRATYGFSSSFRERFGPIENGETPFGSRGEFSFSGEIAIDTLGQVPDIALGAYDAYRKAGPAPEQVTAITQRVAASIPLRFRYAESLASMAGDAAAEGRHSLTRTLSSFAIIAGRTLPDIQGALAGNFPEPQDLSYILVAPNVPEGFVGCIIQAPREAADC